ncbi:MAG: hypothetical protein CM15mV132_220 [uncultured marine virus]|nr:MAG: hypothetical protein CM15mV132_220 [uncultured marine virus]
MRDPRYYDPARRDKAYVQEVTRWLQENLMVRVSMMDIL